MADAELDDLLSSRSVFPVFQPVVDLATMAPVAFEALARGPAGGTLHGAQPLFSAARRAGRLGELDRLCQARALEEGVEAELTGPLGLFLNVESEVVDALPAELLAALVARGVPVTVELTERALTADPARLISHSERFRAHGLRIALDDVGADPASVALMPLLRPDVVKLDMSLVQQRASPEIAQVMTAVTAYAEQTGAWVLAEGVETDGHELVALSLGACLAQGWRYGRPGALPANRGAVSPMAPLSRATHPASAPAGTSPFAIASRGLTVRRGTRPLLAAVSGLLESQAADLHGHAVVLATFEGAEHFTPGRARTYSAIAEHSTLVVVFGVGLGATPAVGVRGADIPVGDPLAAEWDVVVVGPHFAAALVARERLDDPQDGFDYVLTYDRAVVLEIARLLMGRVAPVAPPPDHAPEMALSS